MRLSGSQKDLILLSLKYFFINGYQIVLIKIAKIKQVVIKTCIKLKLL